MDERKPVKAQHSGFWIDLPLDDEVFQARINPPTNAADFARLAVDNRSMPMAQYCANVAPFVTDWNLSDAAGKPVPAPSVCDGTSFNYLPVSVFWAVMGEVVYYGKRSLFPSPEVLEGVTR